MSYVSKLLRFLIVGQALTIFAIAPPVFGMGDVIVDSGGFESYTVGTLQGQDGWLTAGNGGGTAVVQSGTVQSGTKAVRVDRGANSDDRWAVPVGGGSSDFPTDPNRYILIDWDMNVDGTGATGSFGPFFGVDTYDDTNGPNVLGSLGVDATTGDILYQAAGSGVLVESGTRVGFGEWHHYRIRLDFVEDEYQVFVDGFDLGLGPIGFVDGPTDVFTDADIATFAAAFDPGSQALTANAYFDNFLVREVLPQPGDFDIDGDVDEDDLSLWESALGATSVGDADNDGDSDGADFLLWQQNFGSGVSPLEASVAVVPEPSALALALFGLSGVFRRRR